MSQARVKWHVVAPAQLVLLAYELKKWRLWSFFSFLLSFPYWVLDYWLFFLARYEYSLYLFPLVLKPHAGAWVMLQLAQLVYSLLHGPQFCI